MNKNNKDETEIGFLNLNDKTFNELLIQRAQEKDDEIIALKDMKETFMKLIFEPYRFSKATICKSLRVTIIPSFTYLLGMSPTQAAIK
jgi:hypothetical protein